MKFIVPSSSLVLAYGPAVVPPHSYVNLRFVLMQRGWQAQDRIVITFNSNPSLVISPGSTSNSQIICAGVASYTVTI